MATEEKVKELQNICEQIKALAPQKSRFIKRDEWGTQITFKDIEDAIDTVFWLVDEIAKLPARILPEKTIGSATKNLLHIKSTFNQINEFTISGDPVSQRNGLAIQLRSEIDGAMSHIGVWLPALALYAGEIENWGAKMKGIDADMRKTFQETFKHCETRKKEIDEAAQAARVAAGEAGAAEFTHEFRDEAKSAAKQARRWLWPTGIFATLALVISTLLIFGMLGEVPADTWEAVYRLGGRVIAISVLFYAAVWSGRVVLANMHLASVNKHRAVSLQTLQAFHHAAEDAAAKDAVVLEAARAVYENVPSGYIGRQAAEHGASTRVVELIKSANKASQTSD